MESLKARFNRINTEFYSNAITHKEFEKQMNKLHEDYEKLCELNRLEFNPEDLSKMTPGTKKVMVEKLGKKIEEVLDNPKE